MFGKGSRYRNLPESSVLTAQGERLRGKELRVMPRLQGRFQHTVRDGDRLDLLAFKYYGDAARWWQIADANPEIEFPVDLVDRLPAVEERMALRHQGFYDRFEDLREALGEIGEVRVGATTSFDGGTAAREPDFIESSIIMSYGGSAATRQQVIAEINARFHLLRSFTWRQDQEIFESFTFDDQSAKAEWQALIANLGARPGVLWVRSTVTEASLEIAYRSNRVSRPQILAAVNAGGFSVEGERSAVRLRAGAKIVVPPNQIA